MFIRQLLIWFLITLAALPAFSQRRRPHDNVTAPTSYQVFTDRDVIARPVVSGTEADLTVGGRGAGYKFFDLTHDIEIMRLTDANTHVDDGSSLPNRTFGTMSGAGHSSFSKDGDMYMGLNGFGNALFWNITYSPFTATRITPLTGDGTRPIDLKNEPWFSLVENRKIYGVDTRSGHNNNLKITELNFTNSTYTVLMDLSTLGITFSGDSNAHEGAHTAGVTSTDALPDEWIGAYWGGSSGDYDRYYSIFKKSDPAGTIKTLDTQLKRIKSGLAGSWTTVTAPALDSTFPSGVTITVSGTGVTGGGSADFTNSHIVVGQSITLTTSSGSETREVTAINSSTSMTVSPAFTGTATGVSGTSVAINGTRIHSAQMDRKGDYVIIYKSLRTNPVGSIVAIWNTTNDTFQLANNEVGHAVNGIGVWINNAGNTSPMQWLSRPLSNVTDTGQQKLLVGGEEAHPGAQFAIAEHPAFLNASPAIPLPPFISGIYRYGTDNEDLVTRPWKFWHDEVIAIQTNAAAQSATVWRLGHHMSDIKGDTGGLTSFWYSPRVQVNRQGTMIAWTSNWDKTLGACTGCDSGQNFRSDIFLAKLPTSIPPVSDASSVSVSSITDTTAVVTFTLSEKGRAEVGYSTDLNYGSTAKDYIIKSGSRSVTLTGLSAGNTYNIRTRGMNRAGTYGAAVTTSFTTTGGGGDITAPVISSITASDIGGEGAKITWTTDEAADTQIEFGATTSYGFTTTLNNTDVTSHAQGIYGGVPGATWHYRVLSRDTAGNLATSADQTITFGSALQTDDFNDNSRDTGLWALGSLALEVNTVGVNEVNSRLEITPLTGTGTASFYGYASQNTFNFTNNRAVTIQVTEALATNHEVWLLVGLDASNYVRIAMTGGANIIPRKRTGGSNSAGTSIAYNSANHQYMRIRWDSAESVMVWEVSADDVTYTELRREAPGFAITALKVYHTGGNAASLGTATSIKQDNSTIH